MHRLWKGLNSQLRYQIIFPFLLLTFVVAVAGSFVVFYLLSQALKQRFDTELANVTRSASDALISQEQANLQFLRQAAFASANVETGAPSVADAIAAGDSKGLAQALEPFFKDGALSPGVRLDRLIAFDTQGRSMVDFERRTSPQGDGYITNPPIDLNGAWFTDKIISGTSDDQGDKYAGLIQFADTNTLYFATIAPVYKGDKVAGGLIAAMHVDSLLAVMTTRSRADGITLYDQSGRVISTTFGDTVAPMSLDLLSAFEANTSPFETVLFRNEVIDNHEYQFAYVPLMVRGSSVGILAPARSRDYILDTWNSTVWPVMGLIGALALAIFVVGIFIARHITMPLEELARTSTEIAEGKLDRRARIGSENEIGQLAVSFNQMTEFLVRLYDQVQAEASQRAAIVESITDGIVVVDDQGNIKMINRATRRLMSITDDAPMPEKLSDIPMQRLVEGVPGFGTQRAQDLFTLGEYIVRASIAPVVGGDGTRSGYVCLLQDMTAEVEVDRARTNFIGTISHELKTPLQVISGNADVLIRGMVGRLNDEQANCVEAIRQHTNNMTGLLQNVITIAHLDSGATTTDLAPVELLRPIDEANWRVQSQIKAKGLTLNVQIPEGLRPVLADFDHVRQVVYQLLDNARRYTHEGSITVRALDCGDHVRVEVTDTGRGIPPDMQEQVFQRFIRGDGTSEGINSAERGIGLGLAICKQLVERQGGTIGVTSIPNQGSTFYFTLRYANDTSGPENETTLAAAA
ncbi:MAG: HAMP domain-containing protein [Chloroflexales bacterium]|nr:HAMP domain-containing protein [Chloroflexales bacterium]